MADFQDTENCVYCGGSEENFETEKYVGILDSYMT